MKIVLEKRFSKELAAAIKGYNMRVGVFTGKKHKPAASKLAGHGKAFGYKTRKTHDEARKEVQAERKKLRAKVAKIRADAREKRIAARSAQSRTVAKSLRAKAKRRMEKARALSDTQPKVRKKRKATRRIKEVFLELQKKSGIDLLYGPFLKDRPSREVREFIRAFLKTASKNRSMGKVEKLLVDAVRTPILKRRYGKNSHEAIKTKGFDRRFFDTAQVVSNIEARIKRRKTRPKKKA